MQTFASAELFVPLFTSQLTVLRIYSFLLLCQNREPTLGETEVYVQLPLKIPEPPLFFAVEFEPRLENCCVRFMFNDEKGLETRTAKRLTGRMHLYQCKSQ